jgi:tRNA (cytidine/uridine-2'-O-)-methyltransferase
MTSTPFRLNIVLLRPEIPQNTGSIGRLCVNLGARLHLIKPLGFSLDERYLRRAGMDYWKHVDLAVHEDWHAFVETEKPEKLVFASTKGSKEYYNAQFANNTHIVFGNESSGLPTGFYERYKDDLVIIPMPGEEFRSLNLANAVSILAYEAFRQYSISFEA